MEGLLIPAIAFLLGIIMLLAVGIWALRQSSNKSTVSSQDAPLLSAEQNDVGQWIIRVNGKPYASLKDVPDEAVRQEVLAAMRAIVVFGRDYVRKPENAPAQPAAKPLFVDDESPVSSSARPVGVSPASAPQRTQRPAPEPPARPSASASPAAPAVTETPERPAAPVRPPSVSLKARVANTPATPASTQREAFDRESFADALLPMLDLAAEIEAIVHEMQPRYPSLAQRVIRLQNAPGRGVRVAVDGIVYESVDEVPDPDIQSLIRAATREWERR